MPKYLVHGSYSIEGVKGLLQEGGSARRAALTAAVEAGGGTLEAFYYCFGSEDVIAIVEMPSQAAMAGASLRISSTGSASLSTTVLIEPEEIDQALGVEFDYRAPGT